MKFLLTSSGITTPAIAQAVMDLVGLPKEKIKVAFVPTAADRYQGDKGWLIDDLVQFQKQGYAQVDIVPIAGLPRELSLPRLEAAHLICFGGGSEFRLMRVLHDTGLAKELPRLLETRVHMGISAGTTIVGYHLSRDFMNELYLEDPIPEDYEEGFGWIDCIFLPHYNAPYMSRLRKENIEPLRGTLKHPLYAIDDQTALKVVDGKIEIVGSGEYFKL